MFHIKCQLSTRSAVLPLIWRSYYRAWSWLLGLIHEFQLPCTSTLGLWSGARSFCWEAEGTLHPEPKPRQCRGARQALHCPTLPCRFHVSTDLVWTGGFCVKWSSLPCIAGQLGQGLKCTKTSFLWLAKGKEEPIHTHLTGHWKDGCT